jgi:hypothetical protein
MKLLKDTRMLLLRWQRQDKKQKEIEAAREVLRRDAEKQRQIRAANELKTKMIK